MKWFKHISDSADDPFIFDLVDKFGGDGYMTFFKTLEVMAREFDIKTPGISTFSHRFLTKKLQLSRQKMLKILKFCDEKGRIFINSNEKYITLNCPKLKELCDEYTQKQLTQMSGENQEHVGPKEIRSRSKKKKKNKNIKDKDKYKDSVFLSKDEFEKLKERFGEQKTQAAIEHLNNYKMSKGKQYKSDYHAILQWVIGEIEKRQGNFKPRGGVQD